jgi:hypothetical protein
MFSLTTTYSIPPWMLKMSKKRFHFDDKVPFCQKIMFPRSSLMSSAIDAALLGSAANAHMLKT